MAGYVETTNLLCELTESISHAGSSTEDVLTPPTVRGKSPVLMIIASASGDFSIKVGGGDFIAVTASDLTTAAMEVLSLGPGDQVVLKSSSANTIVVRWIFEHPRSSYVRSLRTRTVTISQDTTEAAITMPAHAVELVITELSGNLTYRIDDRSYDGGQVTLDSTLVSKAYPYAIPVFPGQRLRLDSPSGTQTLIGRWFIGDR